jgi:hypothetical protein
MPKVELSLALSSRGRSILNTSLEKHLIALSSELVSTTTILRPGSYSVSLGKVWVSTGEGRTEISAILSFRIESPITPAKQAAVAAAFN